MKKIIRKVITGIFAASAVIGCSMMVSAAATYTDINGDVFTYSVDDKLGVSISHVKDNGTLATVLAIIPLLTVMVFFMIFIMIQA